MKKALFTMIILALTSTSFAGSVGQVNGKLEDCAKLNNTGLSSISNDIIEPDITPDIIETTKNK